MIALGIYDLHKRFGSKQAVRGVTLDVEPSELLTILGPSGCGKTTLLRLITGQLAPDSGRISIFDRDVSSVPTHRRDIGFVFQGFALFPHMTVLENVMFPLSVRGVNPAERERSAREHIALVRLEGLESRYPGDLSGGEQQRVGLARALVYRPRLILLDEPLSNLDAKLREEMRVEVRRIIVELGMTAVYVTHDQEEALSISDRVAIMDEGEILQVGAPEAVYRHPATAFVATFVGSSNLLPATVVEKGGYELDGFEDFTLPCTGECNVGTAVYVVFKPEELSVVPIVEKEKHRGPCLRGKCISASYRGGKTEYLIEIRTGHRVRVVQPRRAILEGEVLVNLPRGIVHAVPR